MKIIQDYKLFKSKKIEKDLKNNTLELTIGGIILVLKYLIYNHHTKVNNNSNDANSHES